MFELLFLFFLIGSFLLDGLVGVLILVAIFLVGWGMCYAIKALIERKYFKSEKFSHLKEILKKHTQKCNELNDHIAELKAKFAKYHSQDFGVSSVKDQSLFNYKRIFLKEHKNNTQYVHYCSLSICRNAQDKPFQYLCKYFGITCDESTLDLYESMLNDYMAAEEGRGFLLEERKHILTNHREYIPFFIRIFSKKKLYSELGYNEIDLSDSHIITYSFKYISAAGNSTLTCDITMDCPNIERFIRYINDKIILSNTVRYQRSLMTKQLREEIKRRDNHTCQICGISTKDEPHLLLEIDHIIPLSKEGKTIESNLQTLCWRCNRKKGNKLLTNTDS